MFWSQKSFNPKNHGKSLAKLVLDVFSLSENDPGIQLPPKKLFWALSNLPPLLVQSIALGYPRVTPDNPYLIQSERVWVQNPLLSTVNLFKIRSTNHMALRP
ncbi:MAG TPA: hypothetical protein VNX68_09160 [Nitrosopumilaceae archaeon]|nr:hypothetical protein [Nitrosopumilaceae archaeon]